jgi:hypothetical protein
MFISYGFHLAQACQVDPIHSDWGFEIGSTWLEAKEEAFDKIWLIWL